MMKLPPMIYLDNVPHQCLFSEIDVNGAFRHSGWVLKETVAHAHNNFNIMVDQTQKRQGVASPPCDEC